MIIYNNIRNLVQYMILFLYIHIRLDQIIYKSNIIKYDYIKIRSYCVKFWILLYIVIKN